MCPISYAPTCCASVCDARVALSASKRSSLVAAARETAPHVLQQGARTGALANAQTGMQAAAAVPGGGGRGAPEVHRRALDDERHAAMRLEAWCLCGMKASVVPRVERRGLTSWTWDDSPQSAGTVDPTTAFAATASASLLTWLRARVGAVQARVALVLLFPLR